MTTGRRILLAAMRLLVAPAAILLLAPACAQAQQRADWGVAAPAGATRPWLGIIVTQVETSDGQSAATAPGLSVARVVTGSPAESAGLRPGDVLLTLADVVLRAPQSLMAAVKGRSAGDALQATILREGRTIALRVTLGSQPAGWDEVRRVVARVPGSDENDATAADEVDDVLLQFEGRKQRPWMGVETMDLEPGLRAYFGVGAGQGVLIETVEAGSPAASGGLLAGDIVLELAGTPVSSGAALSSVLRSLTTGQDAVVAYMRGGTRRIATIRVSGRETAVWNAAVEAPDRGVALEALAAHQRREAARLSGMLGALRRGDSGVAATLEGRSAATGDAAGDAASAQQAAIDALRAELETLRQRLVEIDAEIARLKR